MLRLIPFHTEYWLAIWIIVNYLIIDKITATVVTGLIANNSQIIAAKLDCSYKLHKLFTFTYLRDEILSIICETADCKTKLQG